MVELCYYIYICCSGYFFGVFYSVVQVQGESTLKRNFQQIQEGEGRRTAGYQSELGIKILPAIKQHDDAPVVPAASQQRGPVPAPRHDLPRHRRASPISQRQSQAEAGRLQDPPQLRQMGRLIRECSSSSHNMFNNFKINFSKIIVTLLLFSNISNCL